MSDESRQQIHPVLVRRADPIYSIAGAARHRTPRVVTLLKYLLFTLLYDLSQLVSSIHYSTRIYTRSILTCTVWPYSTVYAYSNPHSTIFPCSREGSGFREATPLIDT